jgi:hypothetical protein
MKSYAKVADTPSRKSRKGMRREVFLANKKATHIRKKAARLERKSLASE